MRMSKKSRVLAADYLAAGSSAMLLAVAYLYQSRGYWIISLFALVPFFWRLRRLDNRGALRLAIMLGTSFLFAVDPAELIYQPHLFLGRLALLNMALIGFSLATNQATKCYGFSPSLIAVLWFPFISLLIRYSHFESFLVPGVDYSPLVLVCSSLFGLAVASVIVVLINAVILLFLRQVYEFVSSRKQLFLGIDRKRYFIRIENVLSSVIYFLHTPRAPPFCTK